MTNQPDIVQPRVRRSGNSGNAPAILAERSTRVLIRVPRLAAVAIQKQGGQSQATAPRAIQRQSLQAQPQLQQQSSDRSPALSAREQLHYSTTSEQPQGSQRVERPTSAAPLPAIDSRQATRIDAAHSTGIDPHSAAPDWLNVQAPSSRNQRRTLVIVGVIVGFVIGAVTWRSHPKQSVTQQSSASRVQTQSQSIPDQTRPTSKASDTTAVESNEPAEISRSTSGPSMPDAATKSTWNWNPKGDSNSPAKIGQHENSISENESTNTPTFTVPSEVPSSDPSRAAWLQGTIDTIHTSPAPVQR